MYRDEKPIAYDAYLELAEAYASGVETKPHNAYYERPAMIAMWPDLSGKRVLDLIKRGAIVTAIDVSDRMLELAKVRLWPDTDLRLVDLSRPLGMFANEEFDFINAPLCLDYIEDWWTLFGEFHRILRHSGELQFSCGHPAFEAEYYGTNSYFSVEQVECTWKGFGKQVVMPSFRRSLQEIMMPIIESGFNIRKVIEPMPTDDFRRADPMKFSSLMHRPGFLCIQVCKG